MRLNPKSVKPTEAKSMNLFRFKVNRSNLALRNNQLNPLTILQRFYFQFAHMKIRYYLARYTTEHMRRKADKGKVNQISCNNNNNNLNLYLT